MMVGNNNRAKPTNISLYRETIDKIDDFAKRTKKNFSEATRDIVNSFFEIEQKNMKKDIVFFFIYPIVLCVFTLYGAIATENLVDVLIEKGMYFDELYILNRIFNIMSFGALSFLIANIYILWKKRQRRSR